MGGVIVIGIISVHGANALIYPIVKYYNADWMILYNIMFHQKLVAHACLYPPLSLEPKLRLKNLSLWIWVVRQVSGIG